MTILVHLTPSSSATGATADQLAMIFLWIFMVPIGWFLMFLLTAWTFLKHHLEKNTGNIVIAARIEISVIITEKHSSQWSLLGLLLCPSNFLVLSYYLAHFGEENLCYTLPLHRPLHPTLPYRLLLLIMSTRLYSNLNIWGHFPYCGLCWKLTLLLIKHSITWEYDCMYIYEHSQGWLLNIHWIHTHSIQYRCLGRNLM